MKLKSLYLVLFLLCMSTDIFAQDKYEQAVVSQFNGPTLHVINVSIENQQFKKTKVNDDIGDRFFDFSALLKQVAIMRNDGWEVWNSSSQSVGSGSECLITYFLRRKLK